MRLVNAPIYYIDLLSGLPSDVVISSTAKGPKDFIHFFPKDSADLHKQLPRLKNEITPTGMIWVSWPKKTAKIISDINDNSIRDLALAIGLVDIKVCAIDEVWSGLKLVIPVKDRPDTTVKQ